MKKNPQAKENYRPVSVLPVLSKVFERLMQKQINSLITDYLSDFLCGYRQGFSTHHALIKLVESWRQSLDSRGYSGAVVMDLSKAFDTINHELLIAKLHAYGFNKESLTLILDIFLIDGEERRSVIISVIGLNSSRVFHKVLF